MTSVTIRPARPDDLRHVHRMIEALADFHGDTTTLSLQDLEQTLFSKASWMTVLVAETNKNLVGYAALYPLFQLQFGRHGIELHHLFVDTRQRGKGIGHALIEASIAHAKANDCHYIAVGTHPDNIGAQDLYLAHGFEAATRTGPRFGMKL